MKPHIIALLLLSACKGRDGDSDTDTSGPADTDDTDPPEVCVGSVLTTAPTAGTLDWYWRDAPHIGVSSDQQTAYTVRLLTASGSEVPHEIVWDEAALAMAVEQNQPLEPSSDYTLEIDACGVLTEIPFTTSAYGETLVGGPESMLDRTWAVNLSDATWIEPAGFGAILSLYFDRPLLLGTQSADGSTIDFLGAQGYYDRDGNTKQIMSQYTWEYPPAAFDESPFVRVTADVVTIKLGDAGIDLWNFALEGTFSADGSTLGGGRASGLGDTRNLGPILELGEEPGAVCDLVSGMGITCIPCPDDQPYCLTLSAIDVSAPDVPGLLIEPLPAP